MKFSEHKHKIKIGVMGSASGAQIEDEQAREMARELGREIGRRGYIFINGASPGLPHDALLGAKEIGALTIGISPAFSQEEHEQEYRNPHDHDIMLYTGMGFMERDIINIRSSSGTVIVGGGVGTLNELIIAFDEGHPVGVLTSTGGISNSVPHILVDLCKRQIPPNMVFDDDPKALLNKIEEAMQKYPRPIHEDGRVKDSKTKRFLHG